MNPEPRVIAEVGGAVVAEQGPLVLVVDRGTGPTSVVAFLFGIFALILGGFGAVTLITALIGARGRGHTPDPAQPFPTAAHLSTGGGVQQGGAGVHRCRRPRHCTTRRSSFRAQDADGLQLPKLVAVTPDGARVLKRGNPFAGGIGNLDAVLTAAIHGVG